MVAAEVVSLSTHVIDAARGGGRPAVPVVVHDDRGAPVGEGITDTEGRIAGLAVELPTGSYRISWQAGGGFLSTISATVELDEQRHYHVPLLVSDVSAVAYLGV